VSREAKEQGDRAAGSFFGGMGLEAARVARNELDKKLSKNTEGTAEQSLEVKWL
jgi:hypothetical protein